MSTTVKVFIILNLILALAFTWITMTLYATNENWKRRWNVDTTELGADLKASNKQLLNESYAHIAAEHLVRQHEGRIAELDAKVTTLATTVFEQSKIIDGKQLMIEKQEQDIAGLREDNRTLASTLEATRQRNTELTHIASVARAVAFQLNVKLEETEDDYNNSTTELSKRDQEIAGMTKEENDLKAKLFLVKERHPAVYNEIYDEHLSHKFLQAVVAAVRKNPQGQQDLVMLTIGNEEGVEEGMEFIVFRANKYVVKVRAERIIKDMVACRVIPDSWNANGLEVQQGDMAQNRL